MRPRRSLPVGGRGAVYCPATPRSAPPRSTRAPAPPAAGGGAWAVVLPCPRSLGPAEEHQRRRAERRREQGTVSSRAGPHRPYAGAAAAAVGAPAPTASTSIGMPLSTAVPLIGSR